MVEDPGDLDVDVEVGDVIHQPSLGGRHDGVRSRQEPGVVREDDVQETDRALTDLVEIDHVPVLREGGGADGKAGDEHGGVEERLAHRDSPVCAKG